jgi:hypothetical protein
VCCCQLLLPTPSQSDVDGQLHESVVEIRQYTQTIIIVSLMISPSCLLFLVRLGIYIVNLCSSYFYRIIGKLTSFFATSGVHLPQSTSGQFHYLRGVTGVFSSQLKSKVVNILTKTETSHSQTSRLLTSSLSFRCFSPPRHPVYTRRVSSRLLISNKQQFSLHGKLTVSLQFQ